MRRAPPGRVRPPDPEVSVAIYDSGFRYEAHSWDAWSAAARRDKKRNALVADLALEQVRNGVPTLLLAETCEQVRLLQRATGGVVIPEVASEDVRDESHVALHTAPLLLETYTADSGWWDVAHWGAAVLGSPLGCEYTTGKVIQWLRRAAAHKKTAVLIDFDDSHPRAYHRLCLRMKVYTSRKTPVSRIA